MPLWKVNPCGSWRLAPSSPRTNPQGSRRVASRTAACLVGHGGEALLGGRLEPQRHDLSAFFLAHAAYRRQQLLHCLRVHRTTGYYARLRKEEHAAMTVAGRIADLIHSLKDEDIEALPPAVRRRFGALCRHAALAGARRAPAQERRAQGFPLGRAGGVGQQNGPSSVERRAARTRQGRLMKSPWPSKLQCSLIGALCKVDHHLGRGVGLLMPASARPGRHRP